MSAVSSIVNLPNIQNFMFRNYNLPAGLESHYVGSCQYKMWEAIRASSAAPGYYEECKLGDYVHQVCICSCCCSATVSSASRPIREQYWPPKGPAQHTDFLFYIQDLHNRDLNMMELVSDS
jgi:hypothetical protein